MAPDPEPKHPTIAAHWQYYKWKPLHEHHFGTCRNLDKGSKKEKENGVVNLVR